MALCENTFYHHLRVKCFIIAYLHLIACTVTTVLNVVTSNIASGSFKCDVTKERILLVDWPWLEPVLLITNLGTHGFYPLPLIMKSNNVHVKYLPLAFDPQCYPAIVHIHLSDLVTFLTNVVWLKFVVIYISALHRRDPDGMRVFLGLSFAKVAVQILYFADYQPYYRSALHVDAYWLIYASDIVNAVCFLLLMYRYSTVLMMEKIISNTEQPPPYVASVTGSWSVPQDRKDDLIVELTCISVTEEKTEESIPE